MIAMGVPIILLIVAVWLLFRRGTRRLPSPALLTTILLVGAATLAIVSVSPERPVLAGKEDRGSIDWSGLVLYTVEGKKVSPQDYAGRVTFVNFWATWCGPCRAEMPSMAKLYNSLKAQGLTMMAITDEDPETVRAYLERRPYPFPILLDPEGKLFRRFKVFALPTTVVLDRDSTILLEHQGAWVWDEPEVLEEFRRFLSE